MIVAGMEGQCEDFGRWISGVSPRTCRFELTPAGVSGLEIEDGAFNRWERRNV
jgi:hypothetical protein